MSEKEKSLAEVIKEAIPKMTDFDKGYFLAKAESAMERAEEEGDDASKKQST